MHQKISKVHDYFLNKLKNQDFQIGEMRRYTITVIIDGMYVFKLWIGNGSDSLHITGDLEMNSFMDLHFTGEDKIKIYNNLMLATKRK